MRTETTEFHLTAAGKGKSTVTQPLMMKSTMQADAAVERFLWHVGTMRH